jgi:hypothetical protein
MHYSIPGWGALEIVTDGSGPMQTGPIEVFSDAAAGSRLTGTEVFEILGYGVSLSSALPGPEHRFYVSVSGAENTGLALYNPDLLSSVSLDVILLDDQGVDRAAAQIDVGTSQQQALFVDDQRLFGNFFQAYPNGFQGTLQISAANGGSVSAIGLIQKRTTGALIAIGGQEAPGGTNLIFPQYANGETGGIRNRTRIVLLNDGVLEDTGGVFFRGTDGSPGMVPIDGLLTDQVSYSLSGRGTLEIETEGSGALTTGSVEVVSDGRGSIGGTEIFELLGYSVSVNAAARRTSHRVYVSSTDQENTGVALYNPGSEDLSLEMILIDSQGAERDRSSLIMAPRQQLARFVDDEQLFQSFLQSRSGSFTGSLHIFADQGRTLSVVGLIQVRTTGALLAVDTGPSSYLP